MLKTQHKILLVEDEAALAEIIQINLEEEGHIVQWEKDGEEGIQAFKTGNFDLVLLDLMLPKVDGIQVCESVKAYNPETPVMMLTAKNAGADRVKGLKAGADDYLGKPFELEELMLRVQNLLNRFSGVEVGVKLEKDFFTIGKQKVFFKSFEVEGNEGERVSIPSRDMRVLRLFYEHKNEVISRAKIIDLVWGHQTDISTRVVDNVILSFRKLFEENPKEPKYFHSVRGEGYMLKLEE